MVLCLFRVKVKVQLRQIGGEELEIPVDFADRKNGGPQKKKTYFVNKNDLDFFFFFFSARVNGMLIVFNGGGCYFAQWCVMGIPLLFF